VEFAAQLLTKVGAGESSGDNMVSKRPTIDVVTSLSHAVCSAVTESGLVSKRLDTGKCGHTATRETKHFLCFVTLTLTVRNFWILAWDLHVCSSLWPTSARLGVRRTIRSLFSTSSIDDDFKKAFLAL
jgi:hypothetical protein